MDDHIFERRLGLSAIRTRDDLMEGTTMHHRYKNNAIVNQKCQHLLDKTILRSVGISHHPYPWLSTNQLHVKLAKYRVIAAAKSRAACCLPTSRCFILHNEKEYFVIVSWGLLHSPQKLRCVVLSARRAFMALFALKSFEGRLKESRLV